MNATQHTPTPWRVVDGWTIEAGTPKAYGIVTCHAAFGIEQKNANAAHIIRCVNAWDNPDLLRARLAELEPNDEVQA